MTARGEIDVKRLNKNYRKMSILYHPDRNRDDTDAAAAKFIELTNAKDTLLDPFRRDAYDVFYQTNFEHEDKISKGLESMPQKLTDEEKGALFWE